MTSYKSQIKLSNLQQAVNSSFPNLSMSQCSDINSKKIIIVYNDLLLVSTYKYTIKYVLSTVLGYNTSRL